MDWHCPERACGMLGLWEDLTPDDGAVSCPSCGADLDLDPEIIESAVVPAVARREARYYAAVAPVISSGTRAWHREMVNIEHEAD
jgi:uncharacterized Zn finger protein (UPF0148 family)